MSPKLALLDVGIKTNILLVDDRPDGLLALEAVLNSDKYHLIKAASGREALGYLLYYDFAVVLLDVQMPELDGFETAKLIRENPRSRETPIIFVTAINKENRHVYKGYEAGAVDYIFKPIDTFVLQSKVTIFVDLFKKNQHIKHQAKLLRDLELREKERQMTELKMESFRRYLHLADAIPHIVLKIEKAGTSEYFNQKWYQYTGLDPELKKPKEWQSVFHLADRRRILVQWAKNRENQQDQIQLEARIKRGQDGQYRWHLISVVAEKNGDEIFCWIVTCTDIHDRKHREEKFKLLSEQLNRSNKELEHFAFAASHDLKEPLQVVISYAQLLNRRYQAKLDGDGAEFLNYITDGVKRMQNLIEGLLSYSLIGKEEEPFKKVDADICLRIALSNLQLSLEASGAAIVADPLPIITANEIQISRLFQNLISNAIKFKGKEKPRIHISAEKSGADWVFRVQDNGIGIKAEYFDRIFDLFRRLHSHSEYEGTGIGLASCKKIIERHNGTIWVDSAYGRGSTFYFKLPRNPESNHAN